MLARRQPGGELAFGKIPAYCKYELYMERYRHAAEYAIPRLAGRERPRVLDIGSGFGHLKAFFDHEKHMEWHGIEVSEDMMRICMALGYKMHIHDIDKRRLPFECETFDLVAGLHVLEHLGDASGAIREMARIVRCGGLLVLGVPSKPPLISEVIQSYYTSRRSWNRTPYRTCNSYSVSRFRKMLRRTLGSQYEIKDLRGFRIFSARKILPLENLKWFYKINTYIGKTIPCITPEINVILRKQ